MTHVIHDFIPAKILNITGNLSNSVPPPLSPAQL